MDLDELRALLAVSEAGSVLVAAERLRVQRTTLRRQLAALEARVGAPLLHRGPRGAQLTAAGEEAARHARVIVAEAGALYAAARAAGEEATGLVRVGLPLGLPPPALLMVYAALRRTHPGLRFEASFAEDPTALPLDRLDLLFHFGGRLSTGSWITRRVRRAPERLLAAPDWLAARGGPPRLDELSGCELLVWRRPGADPTHLPRLDGGVVEVAPALVSGDVHLLRTLALTGGGLVFVPDAELPLSDGLVPVLGEQVGRDCAFRFAAPEAAARSAKVRRLVEELDTWAGPEGGEGG